MPNKYETEKFEYVFVDIEWNQTPGTIDLESREPIQIGVLATDENMNIKKTFSKAIRLSNQDCYNQDAFSLTRLKLNSVMQTNSEETVLQKFKMSFPRYKYVVVWTNETYKLLRIGMDKYGLKMPKHRVVIFQQIIMHIAGNGVKPIGFELALKNEKIEYKKNYLHCSKHDVNYMYQLFCKCYDKYIIWTNHEYCYLNKRTHIVHTNKCRYIRINQKSNLNKTTKEVIFWGNRICKTCGYEYEWNRWIKEVKKEFIALSDMEVAPDDLHDWVEEIFTMSGGVLNLSMIIEGNKEANSITTREEWMINHAIKQYYESVEKLKVFKNNN